MSIIPSDTDQRKSLKIAAILPCYNSKSHVLDVLARFGTEVTMIVCVDDKCPVGTGEFVESETKDSRVTVLFHEENQGVGGATITGMKYAASQGADIVIKVDSDGQMDPSLIPALVQPIITGQADFSKGNRFFNLDDVRAMPTLRLYGNAGLSFLTKLSTGYWNIFDPTNGFVALHTSVLRRIATDKLEKRFFFESDLLFRAGLTRAKVYDMPMRAVYGDEESNLVLSKALFKFSFFHFRNTIKRIFYNYYLRDFSAASLYLFFGLFSFIVGTILGSGYFISSITSGQAATSGQVMLAALPIFVGMQLLLSFLTYDIENKPTNALWPALSRIDEVSERETFFLSEPEELHPADKKSLMAEKQEA